MNRQKRNYWYWDILNNKYYMPLKKSFFELNWDQIELLVDIADAIRCRGENGKTPARTLWDRAEEGRPF